MSGEATSHRQTYDHAPFLRPLAVLSAAMGRELTQVQGPGGNTSLKHEGVLWVKASGTDLADAVETPIFVPVDLETARNAILADEDRPIPALDTQEAEGMRPSIECSLHALMPHRVVLHNHDVNVIVWAARADAKATLGAAMAGLNWAFVPYARPGLPLTRAVRAVLDTSRPDILVLGNHGLVVGGETPEAAAAHLDRVRERLEIEPRTVAGPDHDRLHALCEGTRFAPAAMAAAHLTALDEAALHVAAGGVLYPDHVVFLGPDLAVLPQDGEGGLEEIEARLVAVPGAGVLIEKSVPEAAQAMAACLGLVSIRFPQDVDTRYLNADDIAALLGWDAEKYRQELARRKAAAMQG